MADKLSPEQEKIIDYFNSLDPSQAREQLSHIISMTDYGAKIDGKELGKIYEKLGMDRNSGINYELADQLTEIYRKVMKTDNSTGAEA